MTTLLHIYYFESTKFYSSSHITYLMRLQPARYPSMAPFQWDLCGSDQWSKRLVGLGALAFKSKGWPEGLSPKVQNCKKVNIIIELECWRLAGPKHLFLWRQISIKTSTEFLHLAKVLMELLLQGNVSLLHVLNATYIGISPLRPHTKTSFIF